MARVQQVDKGVDLRIVNRILEQDGCVVLRNAIDREQLQELKKELRPHLDETPNCSGDFLWVQNKKGKFTYFQVFSM